MLSTIFCYGDYPNAMNLKHKIFQKTMKEKLAPANHYQLIGYGGHSTKEIMGLVSAHFEYRGCRTQEQMEDMLINTVETVLQAYNSNKKIRPLLVDYPMTQEHFHIIIGADYATLEHPTSIDGIYMTHREPYYLSYTHHDPVTGKPTIKAGEFGDPYDVVKARRAAAHAAAAEDSSTSLPK